jgi:predicted deacylase
MAQSPFSATYADAQARFLKAATKAGARLTSEPHPLKGPNGEPLAIDVARMGPENAPKLLAITSGTHGIEGYTGSAIQTKLMEDGIATRLPPDTELILIHAVNPWGFAHGRRVNEDNIDLNRNFLTPPFPENPGYDALHEMVLPREWNAETIKKSQESQLAFIEEHGFPALVEALSIGQYTHPDGLFYGGQAPAWSNRIMRALFDQLFLKREAVGFIDIHTGLGERGAGELLCTLPTSHPVYQQSVAWLGDDVRSTSDGTSVSADVRGPMKNALIDRLAEAPNLRTFAAISIEYGTVPSLEVAAALQADNWLYAYGDPKSPQGREIAKTLRGVFLIEEADWAQTVHEQAERLVGKALKGLAAA